MTDLLRRLGRIRDRRVRRAERSAAAAVTAESALQAEVAALTADCERWHAELSIEVGVPGASISLAALLQTARRRESLMAQLDGLRRRRSHRCDELVAATARRRQQGRMLHRARLRRRETALALVERRRRARRLRGEVRDEQVTEAWSCRQLHRR